MDKRVAIFVPRHMTSWVEMSHIAEKMKYDGRLEPKILFCLPPSKSQRNWCDRYGISSLDLSDHLHLVETAPLNQPLKTTETSKVETKSYLKKFVTDLLRAVRYCFSLNHNLSKIYRKLKQENVAIVLIPGDRELSPVPEVIKAAKKDWRSFNYSVFFLALFCCYGIATFIRSRSSSL